MLTDEKLSMFDKMKRADFRAAFMEYKNIRLDNEEIRQQTEEYVMSEKCVEDINRLQAGDYYFSIPIRRMIPKNNSNKKRIIYRFSEDETALMRLMAYALQGMDDLFSDGLFSFRRGVSAKDYFRIRKDNPLIKDCYAIKADIKSYGNSLNIEILTGKIRSIFENDPAVRDFFTWLLNRRVFIDKGELVYGDTAGLPGCPIHNFFTNIYLSEIDEYFFDKSISYARYSDDILIYVDSEATANEDFEIISNMIGDLKLSFNEAKTRICKVNEPIEFLGMELNGDEIDIAPTSMRKLKRRMRMRAKKIEKQKRQQGMSPEEAGRQLIAMNMHSFFGKDEESRMSWKRWAFPVITKTDGLQTLDLYNQYCIRYVMTGKWSKAQYRVKYQKLKELGYRSLVRAYYEKE